VGYTYNGILLSLEKEEILVICDNTDVPGGYYLNKINLTQNDKYMILLM
jgi:hypothetical protein